MDYNHIKNYLDKFKNIISSKEEDVRIITSVIENNTSIKIDNKNIQIKKPLVFIKASPLVRGEIILKKEKIIKEILLISPGLNIKDIK